MFESGSAVEDLLPPSTPDHDCNAFPVIRLHIHFRLFEAPTEPDIRLTVAQNSRYSACKPNVISLVNTFLVH
jgi:hypothetical protein